MLIKNLKFDVFSGVVKFTFENEDIYTAHIDNLMTYRATLEDLFNHLKSIPNNFSGYKKFSDEFGEYLTEGDKPLKSQINQEQYLDVSIENYQKNSREKCLQLLKEEHPYIHNAKVSKLRMVKTVVDFVRMNNLYIGEQTLLEYSKELVEKYLEHEKNVYFAEKAMSKPKPTELIFQKLLNDFDFDSSWIDSLTFYPEISVLTVSTKNQDYKYAFPEYMWNELKQAESVGKFYTHNIKHEKPVVHNFGIVTIPKEDWDFYRVITSSHENFKYELQVFDSNHQNVHTIFGNDVGTLVKNNVVTSKNFVEDDLLF